MNLNHIINFGSVILQLGSIWLGITFAVTSLRTPAISTSLVSRSVTLLQSDSSVFSFFQIQYGDDLVILSWKCEREYGEDYEKKCRFFHCGKLLSSDRNLLNIDLHFAGVCSPT